MSDFYIRPQGHSVTHGHPKVVQR